MKIFLRPKAVTAKATVLPTGNHVGIVLQIADVGLQPGYQPGDAPYPAIAVTILTDGGQITKSIRKSESERSHFITLFRALLPPDHEGEVSPILLLGCPIAIEVESDERMARIVAFRRPEQFELDGLPKANPEELICLESPDDLDTETGKAVFLKLHRDIRVCLSKRIRG